MQKLIKIYQWHAPRSQTDYLRFVFALELDHRPATTPHDSDITRALWLTLEEFNHYIAQPQQCERNPLVIQAIQDYQKGESYPLDLLSVFE